EFAKAIICFDQALAVGEATAQLRFARGRAYQQDGQYERAAEEYRQLAKVCDDPRVKACLAYCNGCLNNHRLAAELYGEVIKAGDVGAVVLNNLGYSYCRDNAFTKALENFGKAIELDPKLQAAYHNRARVLAQLALPPRRQGTLPDAIRDIGEALKLGPKTAELYYDAACYCAQDPALTERALDHLDSALALGISPRRANGDLIFAPLVAHPRFAALLRRDRAGAPASIKPVLLVDPVTGIPALRGPDVGGE